MVDMATIEINEISPKDLEARLSEFVVIDVREEDEFTGDLGHIAGAKLVTLGDDLEEWFHSESEKDKQYAFICRSGRRSDAAARMAKAHGFSSPWNLVGGMIAWKGAGLKIER